MNVNDFVCNDFFEMIKSHLENCEECRDKISNISNPLVSIFINNLIRSDEKNVKNKSSK